jgi:hypothetical protein
MEQFMISQGAVLIAFFAGYFLTLLWSARAGRGDSQEPHHIALQTREDVGSLYASSVITNGLLAAILAALVLR